MDSVKALSHAERIGSVHLYYLALLPAAATFAYLGFLDGKINPMLLLLVGTAAVGIYLAVTGSYFQVNRNPVLGMIALIDGPIWAVVTAVAGGSVAQVVVNDFLIEASGILAAVMAVVLTSGIPTAKERRASFIAVGIPLLGVAYIVYRYATHYLLPEPWQLIGLLCGVAQTTVTQFRLTNAMHVERHAEGVIVIGIVAWLAAMFAGYGVYTWLQQ